MMNFNDLINTITPEGYDNLKRAVELGKWPNGARLSDDQKTQCMQAVIAYEQKNIPETERVGYIDKGPKKDGEICGDDEPTTVKIINK